MPTTAALGGSTLTSSALPSRPTAIGVVAIVTADGGVGAGRCDGRLRRRRRHPRGGRCRGVRRLVLAAFLPRPPVPADEEDRPVVYVVHGSVTRQFNLDDQVAMIDDHRGPAHDLVRFVDDPRCCESIVEDPSGAPPRDEWRAARHRNGQHRALRTSSGWRSTPVRSQVTSAPISSPWSESVPSAGSVDGERTGRTGGARR